MVSDLVISRPTFSYGLVTDFYPNFCGKSRKKYHEGLKVLEVLSPVDKTSKSSKVLSFAAPLLNYFVR